MRRLRSTYTLLSENTSPTREDDAQRAQVPSQQFTWSQLFSSEPWLVPNQEAMNFSSTSTLDNESQQNVQDVMEHQHNLIKAFQYNSSATPDSESVQSSQDVLGHQQNMIKDLWKDSGEDISGSVEPSTMDISSVNSESSYGPSSSVDDIHLDRFVSAPIITPYGSISILLRHLVRVDVGPDGAIYVQNYPSCSVTSVNGAGDKTSIMHSNCRVYQEGNDAHVMTYQDRIAKICQRGVVFSSSSRSIAYLVDESGTKSTADRFMDLRNDFSLDVFYDGKGAMFDNSVEQCYDMMSKMVQKQFQNGDDVWLVGGTHIKQDRYGNIEVSRDYRRRIVTVLPTVGEISVQTPYFSATVGCYSKRYLTVQMDNRRITSGYCGLTAQNGSQRAGLDRNGKVVIF